MRHFLVILVLLEMFIAVNADQSKICRGNCKIDCLPGEKCFMRLCTARTGTIKCKTGVIKMTRFWFGREETTKGTCGISHTKYCINDTLHAIQNKNGKRWCDDMVDCTFKASFNYKDKCGVLLLYDPCDATPKYIEAEFECIDKEPHKYFGPWTQWSTCYAGACDTEGDQKRTRQCIDPVGKECTPNLCQYKYPKSRFPKQYEESRKCMKKCEVTSSSSPIILPSTFSQELVVSASSSLSETSASSSIVPLLSSSQEVVVTTSSSYETSSIPSIITPLSSSKEMVEATSTSSSIVPLLSSSQEVVVTISSSYETLSIPSIITPPSSSKEIVEATSTSVLEISSTSSAWRNYISSETFLSSSQAFSSEFLKSSSSSSILPPPSFSQKAVVTTSSSYETSSISSIIPVQSSSKEIVEATATSLLKISSIKLPSSSSKEIVFPTSSSPLDNKELTTTQTFSSKTFLFSSEAFSSERLEFSSSSSVVPAPSSSQEVVITTSSSYKTSSIASIIPPQSSSKKMIVATSTSFLKISSQEYIRSASSIYNNKQSKYSISPTFSGNLKVSSKAELDSKLFSIKSSFFTLEVSKTNMHNETISLSTSTVYHMTKSITEIMVSLESSTIDSSAYSIFVGKSSSTDSMHISTMKTIDDLLEKSMTSTPSLSSALSEIPSPTISSTTLVSSSIAPLTTLQPETTPSSKMFVKVMLKVTWEEFCKTSSRFQDIVAYILTGRLKTSIDSNQVKIKNLINCNTSKDKEAEVEFFIIDKETNEVDEEMTQIAYDELMKLLNNETSDGTTDPLKEQMSGVQLINGTQESREDDDDDWSVWLIILIIILITLFLLFLLCCLWMFCARRKKEPKRQYTFNKMAPSPNVYVEKLPEDENIYTDVNKPPVYTSMFTFNVKPSPPNSGEENPTYEMDDVSEPQHSPLNLKVVSITPTPPKKNIEENPEDSPSANNNYDNPPVSVMVNGHLATSDL